MTATRSLYISLTMICVVLPSRVNVPVLRGDAGSQHGIGLPRSTPSGSANASSARMPVIAPVVVLMVRAPTNGLAAVDLYRQLNPSAYVNRMEKPVIPILRTSNLGSVPWKPRYVTCHGSSSVVSR